MSESDHEQFRLREVNSGAFSFENARVLERGQVTIPHRHRESYTLNEGDYVDVEVYYNNKTIRFDDAKIGNSGRITIPSSSRKRHGIEPGDRVDVTIFPE